MSQESEDEERAGEPDEQDETGGVAEAEPINHHREVSAITVKDERTKGNALGW